MYHASCGPSLTKFSMLEYTLLVEIHQRLRCVYDASVVVSLHTVEQRHKKFGGHTSISDAAWSGKPSRTIDEMVRCVHSLLEIDRHYTISDLRVQMAARCRIGVPNGCQLTETNWKLCMGWALRFPMEFLAEGNASLKHIIIRDESWIYF